MFAKPSMIFAAVILSALPLTAGRAHEPTTPTATSSQNLPPMAGQAVQTVDMFHAALGRGDTATALSLLSADAVIFEEGGAERSKAEYAAHHLAADAEFTTAVPSTQSRRTGRAEGSIAWIATEGRTTGSFKGRAVDRLTTETMVLRREGAAWKIVHIHWSSRNAPV